VTTENASLDGLSSLDRLSPLDGLSPLDRLSQVAAERGLRICVVESLTSGRLSSTVGAGADAGTWFAGGLVAYLTDVKERMLGLTPGTDPCSAECAEQLAANGRQLFDADLCVSTTGVGGPEADGGHEPGTVFLGWATDHGVGHRMLALTGDPSEVLDATVDTAARLLAFYAEGLHPAGPRRTGSSAPPSD